MQFACRFTPGRWSIVFGKKLNGKSEPQHWGSANMASVREWVNCMLCLSLLPDSPWVFGLVTFVVYEGHTPDSV